MLVKRPTIPVLVLTAAFLIVPAWGAGDLYETATGLYPVVTDDSVSLGVPGEERELPLRIVYPKLAGPHPVIVFSHGTFSSGKRYGQRLRLFSDQG